MKTRFYLFIATLLLLCVARAKAHDFEVGGIYYNIISETELTVEVTYKGNTYTNTYNEYIGDIVIPETVMYKEQEYAVKRIGEYAFYYNSQLTGIIISSSITSVEKGAFALNNITKIVIPANVKKIGNEVFDGCSKLKEIIISDSESSLSLGCNYDSESMSKTGEGLFYDCPIETLYIGRNLSFSINKPMGYSPFYTREETLSNIIFSKNVTQITSNTLYGCPNLQNITIPYSVTSLGSIQSCGLTSIAIPSSVTSSNDAVCSSCKNLKTAIIPTSLKNIPTFYDCISLSELFVLSSTPQSISESDFRNSNGSNNISNITLYIPYGSTSAYKSAAIWSKFANYVEFNQPNNPTHQPVTLYMPDITGAISRWEYSRDGGATWTNIECEEYCYTETDPERGEVLYRVLKTDGTYNKILTINYYDPVPETIATTPASETKTVDESVTFALNVKNDGYTYQWMLNNVAIEGAINSTYQIPIIKMKDAGDYHCVVSNPVSSVNSTSSKLTVNKCPQIITLPEFETKTYGDASFTLPATTDKGLTINYQSTNTSVATIDGNVVTIKEPGETNIIATQAGNDDYLEAAYVSRKLTVKKLSQTIIFNELQEKTFEDIPFTLPATTDRGLTISYQSTNTNVATVDGNTVTIVGAGTTDIIATQQGDEHHYAATPVSRTLTINRQVQTITFNAFGNVVYGDAQIELNQFTNKNFEIKYTSSNTDVATVNGNIITIVKPGVTVIKATQNGNKNYLPAQSIERTLIVNKAEQKIEWYELSAKNYGDENFVLPATTDKGLTISYTSDNENVATINGNIVSIKNAGSANIKATQNGDDYYNAATPVTHKLTVSKIAQTITFEELQTMTFGDAPIELNATTNSSSDIIFESSDESIATISGNTLTIVGAGSCIITASCPGDKNYYTAIPVERMLVVNKARQTISIMPVGEKRYGDDSFELNVTTNNNQPVVLTSSDVSVLSINGTTATIRGAGNVTITALQEATDEYEKAETQISVVIDKAILKASVSDAERVYGEANPYFEIKYSGFVNDETKEDLDVMPGAICSATESSNVGEYDIVISSITDKNYVLDTKKAKLVIKKALLTVTPSNVTKVYGEKNPTLRVTYSGFKNNEDETVLLSKAVAFTKVKTMSDAGEYNITAEGANAVNYYFEYKEGLFVVEKAQLIITAENKSINYQDEIPEFTVLYEGFAGSDSETDLDELPQITCDVTNKTEPGTYEIILSGGYDNNYEYTLIGGTLVIFSSIPGDVNKDYEVNIADVTSIVSIILGDSTATDAADLSGDGAVTVGDLTILVSMILGTDTASEAPAKAAATRAAALSTISAEGDGSDLIINVTNPDFPFTAIQFDIYFPEGLEISGVEEDGVYYYDAFVGSRNPSTRSPHTAEAALQPDGSMRVMVYSSKNLNFTGTEGDVAVLTTTAKAGTADGEYEFQIKNAIISNPAGEQQKLAEHTGWITVTDGVTGIDAIIADDAANEEGAIYDLQGRKVTETVKGGIYIKDGKKFVVE